MTEDSSGEILVVCRFRPLNTKEIEISQAVCVDFPSGDKSVSVPQDGLSPLVFHLDHVFKPTCTQAQVYNTAAKTIVESVLQGYNGTVLAYGQTSSGKTFTMTGASLDNLELMGIIPRMVCNVFDFIATADESLEFTVKVSYCEIYMEKIKDLIDPSRKNLKVHEDKLKGVYIGDLSESYVSCDSEVYDLMKFGNENREVGYTDMNAGSSRSHAIFIVSIFQTNTKNLSSKVGKLYLVDLAGSEKVGKTGASGKRLEEAKTINKSLTVLGQVINNLTDGKSTHIPYRDSKLTRVLQDSLGGNSKTSLIITCSPSIYNLEETIGTLRFGIRAKSIKNKPKVNKEYTVAELKLLLAKAQDDIEKKNQTIEMLQGELKKNGGKVIIHNPEPGEVLVSFEDIQDDIDSLKEKLEQEGKTCSQLRNELLQQETINQEIILDNSSMMEELKSCHEEILTLKAEISDKYENIEELKNTKELYELQIKEMNISIAKLEKVVNDQEEEIIILKSQNIKTNEQIVYNEDHLSGIKEDLTSEKEKNLSLAKQIKLLHENIQELSKKNVIDIDKLKSNILKEIELKAQTKWKQEMDIISNDLQNRIKKVIELELALDDAKENYRILEQRLSQSDKIIIKRNDLLEKNIEYITKLYYELLSEKGNLSVQNQVLASKITRLTEKVVFLEEQLKQKEMNKFVEERSFIDENGKLNNSRASRASRTSQISGNIRKPLKGGTRVVYNFAN